MRKNVFKSLLAMCAFAATFTACSNENNEVPNVDQKDSKSVFMKLELPATTKAVEAPVTGAATVNDLHLYFHDGTTILKYVKVDGTTNPSIAGLQTGAKIADVPAAATTVTVYGNIPAGAGLPTGGTLAALKAVELGIVGQSAVATVVLTAADKALTTWNTGDPAVAYAPTIAAGDKYAEVEIAPAVARIEIEGLATTATSAVDAFTLAGIYVNNFFEKFNLGATVVGTKVQYGPTPANYAQGQGLYTVANLGKLYDLPGTAATGTPKEVIAGAGQRWAYQVVPNGNDTDVNEQLQLIFRLSGVTPKAGSSVTFTGDQFLSVRGLKDNSGNIVKLEAGKIYTISKADFQFDESNITPIPNTNAVGVWLKVTVKNWQVVSVKPNL